MRPRRLSMKAFGPFADEEVIRFDALGRDPLFLIHGPTGAGKTSILDAICFALYGETTGGEREGREMRCDLARPSTLTEVVLDFELAGRRYRVRRAPDQKRPKARGEGLTDQKSEAQLWEVDLDAPLEDALPLDRARVLVEKKVTDANAKVQEITGLSAEQFRQVMVLPQGRFRELLLATSENREKIFRDLFQTGVYERLQEALKADAGAVEKRVREHRERQKLILESIEVESLEDLLVAIATATQHKSKAEVAMKQAATLAEAQRKKQTSAEQLSEQFDAHRRAKAALAEFDAREAAENENRIRVKRAKAAREIRSLYDARRAHEGSLDAAKAMEAEALRKRDAQAARLQAATAAAEGLADSRAALETAWRNVERLKECKGHAKALRAAEGAATKTARALESVVEQESARRSSLEANREALKIAGAAHDASRKAVEVLGQHEVRRTVLEQTTEKLSKLIALRSSREESLTKLANATQERDRARKACAAAERVHAALDEAWRGGQAAILASGLADGEACPVCGSIEHPHPARADGELPTQVDVDDAHRESLALREALQKRELGRTKAEAEAQGLQSRIDELEAALVDAADADLPVLSRELEAVRAEIAGLRERKSGLDAEATRIEEMKQALEEEARALEGLRGSLDEARSKARAADALREEALGRLPEQYRAASALQEAIEQAERAHREKQESIRKIEDERTSATVGHASAQTALEGASAAVASKTQELEASSRRWHDALVASPFANEEEFVEASKTIDEIDALDEGIRRFDDDRLQARTTLRNNAEAIEGKAEPDVEPIRAATAEAERRREESAGAYHRGAEKLKQLEKAREQLDASSRDQQALEQEFAVIGTIADIANGKNAHNLSLQRFVLAVLLDDVLVEADHRLKLMTRNRYSLLRKEDVADGRRKAGLDLEVEDAYTGKTRSVSTLSGGESFMAALSLALGLSDVVQAYAGGIRLDTLFIDEGFGSLDPDSLELAIRALLDLQASGRMVGLISHVEELKERIDVRLELSTGERGSRARLVVP